MRISRMSAGVIATCPLVELEFLYSARSRADRTEKRRMLAAVFGRVPMSEVVASVTGQPVRRVVDAPSSAAAERPWPARKADDED
jgi:hypothetical protein